MIDDRDIEKLSKAFVGKNEFQAAMDNHDRLFTAMMAELQRMGERQDKTEARVGSVEVRMDKIEVRMDKLEQRMDALEVRMDKLEVRMDNLERRLEKVEQKLDKVIAMLEKVVVRLDNIESEQRFIIKKVNQHDAWIHEISTKLNIPLEFR